MVLCPNAKQCTAHSKRTGERCKNPAAYGFNVCRFHGAHPPGSKKPGNPNAKEAIKALNTPEKCAERSERMKGNALAAIHGANAKKLLSEEEVQIYNEVKEIIRAEYDLDQAADEILLDQLAWNCAKTICARKGAVENTEAAKAREISRVLRELDIRRDRRKKASDANSTPQTIISMILQLAPGAVSAQLKELPAAGRIIDVTPQKALEAVKVENNLE